MRFPKWTALSAGALSAIGFAPIGWWPVTLACFALLMHLVAQADGWKPAAARGYWFGFGHFAVGLNWIAGSFRYQEAMPHWLGWFAVVAVALYLAVYPALCTAGARWLSGTVPSGTVPFDNSEGGQSLKGQSPTAFILIFAALWIVTEWLRATMFTGFAWNPLGVVLLPTLILPIFAVGIGTYGLSGVMIWLSGEVWRIHDNLRSGTLTLQDMLYSAALSFILLCMFVAPYVRPNDVQGIAQPRPLVRIVQPNIGQQDKHNDAFDAVNFAKLSGLTGMPGPEPRLILWPEAAVPDYIGQDDSEALAARMKLAALIGPKDVLLTGAVKLETKDTRYRGYIEQNVIGARNSLFALDGQGRILGRYDKAHLVPYGEYLPMTTILSAIGLSRLVPGTVDFWPGPGPRSFALPGFGKMGVQICYEIIFSGNVVDQAHRPDFLFNPSNDAWFGSWGPPQHLAQARLRAIEEGLPIIRSTPTGISAVIDANGYVLHKLPYQKAGFIQTRLPPPHPPTLFSAYGNKLSLALAFFLGGLGIALRRFGR